MSATNDGGPAFPVPDICDANGRVQCGTFGMSLRDAFAKEVLGNLAHSYMTKYPNQSDAAFALAKECYFVADAMLVAREVGAT